MHLLTYEDEIEIVKRDVKRAIDGTNRLNPFVSPDRYNLLSFIYERKSLGFEDEKEQINRQLTTAGENIHISTSTLMYI